MPARVNEAAPVPPPAYHRAQAWLGPAFHLAALTLATTLHLLTFCRLAVRLAHRRCSPPSWRGTSNVPRGVVVTHRALAHAVATLVSGHA
jgi:hypothetical protein